jgi:asparagine synthase (glutamine-hydrolysing)
MCGITGGAWTDPALAIDRPTLERMTAVLRHRGPDDQGAFTSDLRLGPAGPAQPGVAFGFRRLSIIDLAGGHQPLANEDQTVWVVLNGEIYNFRELRRRLEGTGHRFRTAADTETIVHLYEDEGLAFVDHLAGMFALALWDAPRGRLVLARDRLGKKPLVYRHDPGRLLFASELKSLLEVPGVPREIDPGALDAYLCYQYVPHPQSIFRGFHKLPPGHLAVFENDRLAVRPYWRLEARREDRRPKAQLLADLRARLTTAVERRLASDVPLGAFLSGGVDSSLVVGLMQRLSAEPVRTFSIGFGAPEYDETAWARRVAERVGTRHREFRVEPQAVEVLPQLVWHFDEPFADSSAIPTWYVSQLARAEVTVALTGDGGDELFAGYERYRAVALAAGVDRLPAALRSALAGRWWLNLPSNPSQRSRLRRFKRFVEAVHQSPERRYVDWMSIFNENRRAELYTDEFVARLPQADPGDFVAHAMAAAAGRDPVTAASLADLVTYLPCDLMTKVDIASMAHGLECRQPFLDHQVVELAAGIPIAWKRRWGRGKRILAEAFPELLPAWLMRRRKMGFGVPLEHWFRHELRDMTREVLLSERALGRGRFRPQAVRQLVDEHQRKQFDHSHRLWALLVLELWQQEWVDRRG